MVISDKHEGRSELLTVFYDKGLDKSAPSHMIEEGALTKASNFYYPRESKMPKTRGGLVQFQGGTACPGAITGVHVYSKADGTSIVVVSCYDAAGTGQELHFLDSGSSYAAVEISSSLGSTNRPSFLTYNGLLLVAVGNGQPLRFWQGFTSGASPAAATASIVVDDFANIEDGDTLVVGDRTFYFRTAGRTQPGEIEIGASDDATATNIKEAIDTDCFDCYATVSTDTVSITAAKIGVAGDSLTGPTADATEFTIITFATASTGVDGIALEDITTYKAPASPTIVVTDKNLRVVCGGDTTYPDRLFFSAPGNQHVFAFGAYGGGEYIDVGFKEGNTYAAIIPWKNEVFVHKTGQNKEVYRVHITDPDESTWQLSRKFYAGYTSAVNHRSALSVGDVHIMLDQTMFRTLFGSDAYDELLSGEVGNKVADYLNSVSASSAFMVHNPEEIYTLVFPSLGKFCLCFHVASKRWMTFRFKERDVYHGVYNEALSLMLMGCDDGFVYEIDPDTFTDDGVSFSSQLTSKTYGGLDLYKHQVAGCLLDFSHLGEGTGIVSAIIGKGEGGSQQLMTFPVYATADYLFDATGYFETAGGADNTDYLFSEKFGRANKKQIAVGNTLEFDIQMTGGGLEVQDLLIDHKTVGREL